MNKNKLQKEVPVIALAFVGDAVFDTYIRTMLINKGKFKPSLLHKRASSFSKASAQSKAYLNIRKILEAEEEEIAKRGRNAKTNTMAKNASVADYKNATALETLIGYLHLTDQNERINLIMDKIVSEIEK
ncbi:ribonuclease III domain-containing protein [Proteinivorax hydrogeniformans]|uniref:Mini-ribonuclease 3 n=1 Tax=Proteinivorax hydrogeniformans TaxID=1826727 RepID=A0AAU8HTY1_9FIRM